MANIVFFELEAWERAYLKQRLKSHKLTFIDEPVSSENCSRAKGADVVCPFIYSKIGKKELSGCFAKVKLIATRSTGYDHIDVSECAKRKILVCNVPAYGSETVAEHAMALMLSLAKKIIPSHERCRSGSFSIDGLRTFDLEGKTLGLIGFGKIGSHVSKMARAFNMHVIVYDPYADPEKVELYGGKRVEFDELVKTSDIISLHTPLNDDTLHIINEKTISRMKDGVIIINTARGALIDTKALVGAIVSGKAGAAGLDVLEGEMTIKEERQLVSSHFPGMKDMKTLVANHILLNSPNVIVTPHNAFNSNEALRRILDTTVENIEMFLKNKPINVVNAKKKS